MPGREYSSGNSYRYSMNGQEKESELNKDITNAKFWEYDPRIARRWNIDPAFKKYPDESSYLVFHGNPILETDPNGDEPPKNFKKQSNTVNKKALYVPKSARLEYFQKGDREKAGTLRAINIGNTRFVASYDPKSHVFVGYLNTKTKEAYNSPDITIQNTSVLTSRIAINATVTNTGSGSSAQVIQIVDHSGVNPALVPITPGLTRINYDRQGQQGARFVDGGSYSPFGAALGREAVIGEPYAVTNGLVTGNGRQANTGSISTTGNTSSIYFHDEPGAQTIPLTTLSFQTIIVATNFYGSGQNVIMGVYNWGFSNNVPTHTQNTFTPTTMSSRSRGTLAHDYSSYQLNE